MLGLYLLAAHLVGDFVLQTRWPAAGKFAPPGVVDSLEPFSLRLRHVTTYCLPFIPIAVVYSKPSGWWLVFLAWLFVLHFLTDRQRFTSSPGDWFAWHLLGADPTPPEKRGVHAAMGADTKQFDMPPNPWAPLPIVLDQTLHIVQIAVLAALLLR